MSRFHVAGRSSRAVVAVTALFGALSASLVLAQLTSPSTRRGGTASPPPNTANIGTQALLPDLVATRSGPAVIYESYTADNPCTAHNHTHVLSLQLGGRFQSTHPAAAVVLARGSQARDMDDRDCRTHAAREPRLIQLDTGSSLPGQRKCQRRTSGGEHSSPRRRSKWRRAGSVQAEQRP